MGKNIVSSFVADYVTECTYLGTSHLPAERLKDVLNDFLIYEVCRQPDPSRLSEALKALGKQHAGDEQTMGLLRLIKKEVKLLNSKLERLEDTTDMLLEARMLASEGARMLQQRIDVAGI